MIFTLNFDMYDKAKIKANILPAVASFLCPGLGQAYEGRWFAAVFFFIITAVGYAFLLPLGICVHIVTICEALLYHARIHSAAKDS